MRKRSWTPVILAAISAYILALLYSNLEVFPALHGDEAWIGIYADRVSNRGIYTLHAMNTYTSFFYGWMLTHFFSAFGKSIHSLRILGILFNAAAALMLTIHFYRRFSAAHAFAWLYLLATSSMFLWQSRVAWEVCALQNFLIAAIILLIHNFLERKIFSRLGTALFFLVNTIGVWNHFIFISIPLSLLLYAIAYSITTRDLSLLRFLRLTAANILVAASVYLLKPLVSEAIWQQHWIALTALFTLIPTAAWMLDTFYAAAIEKTLRRKVEAAFTDKARKYLVGFLCVGLFAFVLFHITPLIQIWSNTLLFKRIVSWPPPLALSFILHLWAATLITSYLIYALKGLKNTWAANMQHYERFLFYWPLVYFAIFYFIPTYKLGSLLHHTVVSSHGCRHTSDTEACQTK